MAIYFSTNTNIADVSGALQFQTANITRFTIGSDGKTATTSPVCVYAIQTTSPGAWVSYLSETRLVYNTVITNSGNAYNSTTGIFVCPVSGYYRVGISAMVGNTAAANLYIYRNDVRQNSAGLHGNSFNVATWFEVYADAIFYCNINDSITIQALTAKGGASTSTAGIYNNGYNVLNINLL